MTLFILASPNQYGDDLYIEETPFQNVVTVAEIPRTPQFEEWMRNNVKVGYLPRNGQEGSYISDEVKKYVSDR